MRDTDAIYEVTIKHPVSGRTLWTVEVTSASECASFKNHMKKQGHHVTSVCVSA